MILLDCMNNENRIQNELYASICQWLDEQTLNLWILVRAQVGARTNYCGVAQAGQSSGIIIRWSKVQILLPQRCSPAVKECRLRQS